MSHTFSFSTLGKPIAPDQWIYKYYLGIKEDLDGRTIRLSSKFNIDESTPSMYIYIKGGKYKWKDHSSGKSGDAVDLVKELQLQDGIEQSHRLIISTINQRYFEWKQKHGKDFVPAELNVEHYTYDLVYRYKDRPFNHSDLDYWGSFGINKKLLEEYNIRSLEEFSIGKNRKQEVSWYGANKFLYSYGYFQDKQDLIQIYNPFQCDVKHITFKKEVLGRQQLDPYINRTLIIAASMKDLLTIKSLELEVDVISSVGEKVLIEHEDMNKLKQLYENVLTLFDNDKAGIQAMLMYNKIYNLDFIYIPKYKDIAEFRQLTNHNEVKKVLTREISKKIFKTIL